MRDIKIKNILTKALIVIALMAGFFAFTTPAEVSAESRSYTIGCKKGLPGYSLGTHLIALYCPAPDTVDAVVQVNREMSTTVYPHQIRIKITCASEKHLPISGNRDINGKPLLECNDNIGGNTISVVRISSTGDGGATGGGSGGEQGEEKQLENCTSGDKAGSDSGECIDNFSRCPDKSVDSKGNPVGGQYGVYVSSQNFCTVFDPNSSDTPIEENPIVIFSAKMIGFLSGGIGMILTILLVIAGIRYTLARGNPQESAAAKGMIEKVVWSIILFLFAFALINWLVPGGLLT